MRKSFLTRILHGLLALTVLHQLLVSLFMEGPRHGHEAEGLPGALFDLHEGVGLFAFTVVLAFWVWTFMRRGETPVGTLLPWFSGARLAALKADVAHHAAALRRMDLPPYQPQGALAAATHGLGLVAVTAMGATGAVVYFTAGEPGTAGQMAKSTKEVHEFLANFAWAYFYGHVGISLIHAIKGHDIMRPMFNLQPQRGQDIGEDASKPAS